MLENFMKKQNEMLDRWDKNYFIIFGIFSVATRAYHQQISNRQMKN